DERRAELRDHLQRHLAWCTDLRAKRCRRVLSAVRLLALRSRWPHASTSEADAGSGQSARGLCGMSAETLHAPLDIADVRAEFGGVAALDDVTFTVKSGAIHGVIGPNGAGKTTLMNVISGFVRPTSGAVRLDGVSLLGLRSWQRVRVGVGRTFQ